MYPKNEKGNRVSEFVVESQSFVIQVESIAMIELPLLKEMYANGSQR